MAGLFGLFAGAADRANKPVYSIEHLQHLYNRLQQIKQADDQNREQNWEMMVEVIRQITEALIWGEQNNHDHTFFDFFCEKKILADFVRVLGLQRMPKTVKVQLLQTLSMLVQNIRCDTSLYYLFSNNYVNQLISTQLDWGDEEILGYYISFLKSLAMRLNGETIKFFFNERAEQFPLYIEAVRFFSHREQMVRTAIRTLTLQVYSVQDTAMRKFVLERSWRTYFVHLACHLRELWFRLDSAAQRAASGGDTALLALQEASEQQQDLLMYISDVLGLDVPAISEALVERLLQYALFPVLLGSLLLAAAPDADGDAAGAARATPRAPGRDRLSPGCALFALHQVFDACGRAAPLLEPLVAALLLPRPPAGLQGCCLAPMPPPPPTYRATTADVSGPPSVEAAAREPGDEDVPAGLGAAGFRALAAQALAAAEGGEDADCAAEAPPVRSRCLAQLQGPSDACSLLVAGVLTACLACGKTLPQVLLVGTGLIPRPPFAQAPEVLPLVVQALERHSSLRVVVVQALVSLAARLVAEAVVRGGDAGWCERSLAAARRALRTAARQVRSYLQGPSSDGFLDMFAEEWELHCAPQVGVREACCSVRCLLPPAVGGAGAPGCPAEWALPAPHSERQHAAKAIRCLLLIRRLCPEPPVEALAALPAGAGGAPAAGARPESPLHVPEEVADSYQEQRSFELGRQDRIVCAVATPEGRHTRYLVLHPFLLLLVQPDLVSPGWAIVRTLAPVRAVESHVDRTDPRTLRLGIRLPKGSPSPSEASAYDPTAAEPGFRLTAEEHRGSSFFMLTLSFEDVKRCHCADLHLQKRRQEVRAQMRKRVEAFVDGLCA